MPELPEVTTTVRGLNTVLPKLAIKDVWTDLAKSTPSRAHFANTIKSLSFYKKFKKEIVGTKVKSVERRAKNILIHLSNNKTILIHMKMTGHILYGKYIHDIKKNTWVPVAGSPSALFDPYNRFVHIVFSLSNGKHFVMCDSRKFGTVTILDTNTVHTKHFVHLGPEPLEKSFTYVQFKNQLLKKPTGNIKTVLMDQAVIAGIGNIYSDEMLWLSSIHPKSHSKNIPDKQMKMLYTSMKQVLNKGIDFGGDSMSDYRDIRGMRGKFQDKHNVYRKAKEPCSKKGCRGVIMREVINGRSAHYCSAHQIIYNK